MADHQIDDPKIAFAYLRPSCVLLTKEPTLSNIKALSSNLHDITDGALQLLQDYVLFPLRFVLKTPGTKRDGVVQAVMEAITYVLEKTCVQSWESLRDLFSELCLCVCSPTDPGKPAPVSEELKLSVLRCVDALLHSAYGDVVFKLYEPAMLPGLGAAVSLFLALAEREKDRGVQAAALQCLLSLFLRCECDRTHVEPEEEERLVLGRTLASFLPGIIRSLSHVISGDVRQGHAVTVKALRVWYTTVGLVLADDQLQNAAAETVESPELGRVEQLVVKRTDSWRKSTSERLALALQKVISYTSAHQHWRVRLELVKLSDHLLTHCSRSLPECTGPLLESLVGAVNDEEPRVKRRCDAALGEVSRRNQAIGGQALADVLSENLHSLTTSLPRLMRTADDKRKLFIINVFLGYLKILGPQVNFVLTSAAHLHRISKALMQVLELDVTDVRIVEERSRAPLANLGPDAYDVQKQRKYFLYFTDERIFSALKQICRMLGRYGNLYLLVDHFLELYKESSIYRKQAALVLNEIVTGAAGIGTNADESITDGNPDTPSGVSQDDLRCAITSIIEEYISLNNWHLPTLVEDALEEQQETRPSSVPSLLSSSVLIPTSSTGLKAPTLHQLNSNIWQICIQLEGIGSFALALGTDFCPLLMTSLYPVLEKAGDASLLVSQSALSTMRSLCVACDYGSPKDLVISNADYLLNDVSLNLGRPGTHPHAPRVLAVMFAHSDADLLPLVADVVQDVLTALDLSYEQRSLQFCSVLLSLMKALVRWFPTSAGEHSECSRVTSHTDNPAPPDLRRFLLDYRRQKDLAEGIGAEEDDPRDEDVRPAAAPQGEVEEDDGPDVKPELPLHVSLTKDVMKRCVHLLSQPSLAVRLKVLDIVELCVLVLSEVENELLPMVHRCWPALLQRLTNDDPLAIPRAFRVLCVLGEMCGDFLRKRVCKEVLPRLTSSLSRQAETSARSGPLYTHTLAYKLQLAVLQGLGPLCVRLDLVDSDLDHITEACLPYLSCRQPIRLQEACLSLFRSLTHLDPDACWFALNELYCPVTYDPPHTLLLPVQLSGMNRARNEYTHNVLKLLEEFSGAAEGRTLDDAMGSRD